MRETGLDLAALSSLIDDLGVKLNGRIAGSSADRSRQLVQQLTHLAETLWQPLEDLADPPTLLDEVASDREQLGDAVPAERRARVTSAKLFVPILHVAHTNTIANTCSTPE